MEGLLSFYYFYLFSIFSLLDTKTAIHVFLYHTNNISLHTYIKTVSKLHIREFQVVGEMSKLRNH